jgi:Lon protease-like protein
MGETIERFPLFPLGLVLLPGEMVPLHIFEERYKTMIGHCLDSEREFGIVWMGDEGLREVGCTAEIAQVLDRTEDGRMNILVRGGRPFRLRRRIQELEYPAGEVELLDDHPDSGAGSESARSSYADLVERVTDTRPQESELDELDAYGMAATIEFELASKQQLLELRSEEERLTLLTSLCARALDRFEYAERAAERAQTNGKVHR